MKSFLNSPGTAWGSVQYLFLLTPIAMTLSRDWEKEHAIELMLVLALFYIWKFLILPFRLGLEEPVNELLVFSSPEARWEQVLGWSILTPFAVLLVRGWIDGLLVALALFFVWRILIQPFRAGLKE